MDNNQLLIGVQFTAAVNRTENESTIIELYVPRDITLIQLLEGIKYGVSKLAKTDSKFINEYRRCQEIYSYCIDTRKKDIVTGNVYYGNIKFSSYNYELAHNYLGGLDGDCFYTIDDSIPICNLGFINSSRIIFDATGELTVGGGLLTDNVIEAFDPGETNAIFFPEYNISSRQLYKFDTSPVEIIPPTDPPQKPDNGFLLTILPSIVTVVMLILIRIVFLKGSTEYGTMMIVVSAVMGIVAALATIFSYLRQIKDYGNRLKKWKKHYQDYIDSIINDIKSRQKSDASKLNELYPDPLDLIKRDNKGVYSLSDNMYSRSPYDDDFLSFRIGTSNDVESLFDIKGESVKTIFSEAKFRIDSDQKDKKSVKIFLADEKDSKKSEQKNLADLPAEIARKYRYLNNAPLVYSLKNKGALGVVDKSVEYAYPASDYLISRMIFELCYYHSPENLQFIVFFKEKTDWASIEQEISNYKYLPHFRGLFSDKSQFAFDKQSASQIMSSMLRIMNERRRQRAESSTLDLPHIVFIIYDEYGLREHAFAEFLPNPPAAGDHADNMGLTFINVVKYKEYLPAYCDDIVYLDESKFRIIPRYNVLAEKRFIIKDAKNSAFIEKYYKAEVKALYFLSSIHYAKIAQNGKVPSSVSLFEVLERKEAELDDMVRENWGLLNKKRDVNVTKSLSVPIGKTETDTFYLDIHEKADGPHMLVAGTTGSGKTETVISLLIGLCAKFRPDELNLLLIDMKGGGFTKRLGKLPHVVGAVTDVDGDEHGTGEEYMLRRFLYAMQAEIKRRKMLFNSMHVDSIDAYIDACSNIENHIKKKNITDDEADELRKMASDSPLSHLVLVVDEFTELKRFSTGNTDVDFMGEITTIARVGRSLGFHIILISQNIEGAITDDIRVNSNARLCLRVATKQASKEMLGNELAASPYMPGNGRAYLLVGTGSKFEYFQSAYSGAWTEEFIPIEMILASKSGPYSIFYKSSEDNEELKKSREEKKAQGILKTQLDATIDAICKVNSQNSIPEPHIIFRAPLPKNIILGKDGRGNDKAIEI